ncbi:MAG: aminopeptidase P N-terminal domain-containing protein [Flavobacteriales bacterium]|nr:aminopeptidase P N-terminal domain-containing protein [Flavobacteriales bacterium]
MKYEVLPSALFQRNRQKFAKHMQPDCLAVFNSNDIYPVSADSTMPFKQHRDILYLSGVDQEESILVIFPDAFEPEHREVLFLRETNETIKIWEGEKLTKQSAFELSGIKTVYWLQDFERVFKSMMAQANGIYINTNEHLRAVVETETREDRFIKKVKAQYPAHQVHKAAPIMHRLRSVKEPEEIQHIQRACNITKAGLERVLQFVKPGVWEYEIEAEFIHEFTRRRSQGFAYTPIIASGFNACVLHYIENNQQCQDGDVLLMDVGAEYGNYASDLTRCLPVNGRFTPRQKEVYNAVLRVKNAATQLLRPGIYLKEYHTEVGKLMESELLELGLIDRHDIQKQDPAWPAYKKYFMHGTSHFMGLDTHDLGLWTEPVKAGNVFTCEPGIYIPEERLGIRLEDDLVVQEDGAPLNLMAEIPIEAEHIEELMQAK